MLTIPHSKDHSREILDQEIWRKFSADAAKPALVSFPRTGSHWLRILMELLFQKPTLVRAFFYFENQDYLCWHTHDDELSFQRDNVVYLYRNPVDTVYSQLRYLGSSISDPDVVKACAVQYRQHLAKWLLQESFTKKKLSISYHQLETSPLEPLEALAAFFCLSWDETRAREVLAYVTKEVVSQKTKEHDAKVINTRNDYAKTKHSFSMQHAALIEENVLTAEPRLRKYFPL